MAGNHNCSIELDRIDEEDGYDALSVDVSTDDEMRVSQPSYLIRLVLITCVAARNILVCCF